MQGYDSYQFNRPTSLFPAATILWVQSSASDITQAIMCKGNTQVPHSSSVQCQHSILSNNTLSRHLVDIPQIYRGDPRPCILHRVMVSSVMWLKLGVFGFLPTTRGNKHKQNASMICLRRFTCD